jgi:RHS repeat-associated protein
VAVNGANVTGVNFQMGRSVSGRVTLNGAGLSGVTMTLSGAASRSVAADASGNYAFTGLANGTYTVTPSKAGYTFTPSSQSVTVSGANKTGINFTAAQTSAPQGMAGARGSGGAGENGLPGAGEGATLQGAMGKEDARFQGTQEPGEDAGTALWLLGPDGGAPAGAGAEGQEAQAFEGSPAEATPAAATPTPGALQNVATFFYAWDHLGTVRLVSNQDRTMLERHDYEPFGVELRPVLNQTQNTHQFTGHERDQASGYDYMHFRFYGSTMGRFMKPDAIPGKPRDPQSLNLYTYVQNNPINRVDPLGLNWFLIEGKWQWHKGDRYTVGSGDTAKTYTSNYTHLMVVKLDYVKDGVSHYKVALYNQNKKTPVATGTAFSGGAMRSDGTRAPAVPDGNYFIRGDWHHSAPDRINPSVL